MAGIDRTRRISFEEQADRYDAIAGGYPSELIDALLAATHVPANGRILEIGCGSGQATISFAERGYTVMAVELGARLAELAAAKLRPFPKATVIQHEFESWTLPLARFDLVTSFEAFHWIVPEVGIPKIAQALVPGGWVALVWGIMERFETPLHRAIGDIYAQIAPDWQNPLQSEVNADFILASLTHWFVQAGGFKPLQTRQFSTPPTYINGASHIEELRTFSSHREMPDNTRQILYSAIQAAFQAHEDRLGRSMSYLLVTTQPS